VVAIGFSFGIAGYDRAWQEIFIDAMKRNRVPVHIIMPQAQEVRGQMAERLRREIDLFAWPMKWKALAAAMLQEHRISELTPSLWDFRRLAHEYRRLAERL